MNKKIIHNCNEFEIKREETDDEYVIKVYKGGKQVGPPYLVSKEIETDYRAQTGESMLAKLEDEVRRDIERGLYINKE